MSPLLLQSLTAFFSTILAIIILARAAPALGLVDKPSNRKRHQGEIPLVGGLAIFVALVLSSVLWGKPDETLTAMGGNSTFWAFLACGAFLVITGAVDDRWHVGVFMRVLSEVLVAFAIIEILDLNVRYLGDLLGTGMLTMTSTVSYPFTVIAIFGIINAFNMLDGIDGLLGTLVLATLVIFHVITGTVPGFVSLAVGASLLAFLVSNLSLSPFIPKTFLGDAGSKLLGFIVVCLLLAAASGQVGKVKLIQPVTALFIVALPLYDMVFTSLRRVVRKGSPFAADRSHIHHLAYKLGFSNSRAIVVILSVHLNITFIGLMLHRAHTPEYFQFVIFIGLFLFYCLFTSQAWIVATGLDAHQNDSTIQ